MVISKHRKTDILTDTKQWEIQPWDKGLLRFFRIDRYSESANLVDTFGPAWFLGWTDQRDVEVFVRSRNRYIPLNSQQFVFVPPFSIIHWKVLAGTLRWNAFVSDSELPSTAPWLPAVYDRVQGRIPQTLESIHSFLRSRIPRIQLLQEKTRSPLAVEVKKHLIYNYREQQSIQELAKLFDVSRFVLCHAFRNAYSLSPLQYRQRLRMANAMHRIAQGSAISTALSESGFTCISEFDRQVKNLYEFPPSSLRISQ